ncbi:hypothetical protein [Jiangella alkaliphila]|uniref:hypothetical protein n=1 Tax=Jiangella alkaliphila TaxID=419479 RepID=UPI0006297984|nr:hypothetical protein [Jiangella alkaliphila]
MRPVEPTSSTRSGSTSTSAGRRREALDALRGDGTGDEQAARITDADAEVREFAVGAETRL